MIERIVKKRTTGLLLPLFACHQPG